jgi:diguanylate cyclase (GGDEF)-like protein
LLVIGRVLPLHCVLGCPKSREQHDAGDHPSDVAPAAPRRRRRAHRHRLRGALELGLPVGTAASSDEALRTADERRRSRADGHRIAGASDGIRPRACCARAITYRSCTSANADAATLERAPGPPSHQLSGKPYNHQSLRTTIGVAFRRHEAKRSARPEREKAELEPGPARERRTLRLRREATVDPLTGLHNRRYLEQIMKRELSFAQREGHAVGAILVDLDRFKQLNDSYGHAAGDAALRAVGQFLRSRLRAYDVACRYGGDEIVIIVPGADTSAATALAEQLRIGIEQLGLGDASGIRDRVARRRVVPHDDASPRRCWRPRMPLYRAKAEGHNRVARASDDA